VGVHIADVAFFLEKNTELDKWACKRGTSVYLVHKASLAPERELKSLIGELFRSFQCCRAFSARSSAR
jgi:hypothetical protein